MSTVSGKCIDVAVGGWGVVQLDGSSKRVLVNDVLPNEYVDLSHIKRHKGALFGVVKQRHCSSAHRQAPDCSVVKQCGGCALMHASLQLQHQVKSRWLQFPDTVLEWQTEPVNTERQRARLHWRPRKHGGAQVGYRAAQSHHVVPIETCAVLTPYLNHAWQLIRQALTQLLRGEGTLILTSDARGHVFIAIRSQSAQSPELYSQLEAWHQQGVLQGCVLHVGGTSAAHRVGDTWMCARARGHMLKAPIEGFIQANARVNEQLIETLVQTIVPLNVSRITELYSGFGNLTVPIVAAHEDRALNYHAVESDALSVEAAHINLAPFQQSRHTIQIHAMDACEMDLDCDLLLIDPPRHGAKDVMKRILSMTPKSRPEFIVYVSCHPSTLKRDHKLINDLYAIQRLFGFDMFPHTGHVEALMLLKLRSLKPTDPGKRPRKHRMARASSC